MSFGLSSETITRINTVFRTFPAVHRVLIYGSRAKGTAMPGSDIDLTIQGAEITRNTMYAIGEQLDELLLPYSIDLSVYRNISSKALITHIDTVGKTFYTQ